MWFCCFCQIFLMLRHVHGYMDEDMDQLRLLKLTHWLGQGSNPRWYSPFFGGSSVVDITRWPFFLGGACPKKHNPTVLFFGPGPMLYRQLPQGILYASHHKGPYASHPQRLARYGKILGSCFGWNRAILGTDVEILSSPKNWIFFRLMFNVRSFFSKKVGGSRDPWVGSLTLNCFFLSDPHKKKPTPQQHVLPQNFLLTFFGPPKVGKTAKTSPKTNMSG